MRYIFALFIIVFITNCSNVKTQISYKQNNIIKTPSIDKIVKNDEQNSSIVNIDKNGTKPSIQNDIEDIKKDEMIVGFSSNIIGKYGKDALNCINSYILFKNQKYSVKVYNIEDESDETINNLFETLDQDSDIKVLALFATNTLENIDIKENLKIYLPLIHTNIVTSNSNKTNILYGAIDYKKQIDRLISYSNSNNIVDLYDNSTLGNSLHKFVDKNITIFKKEVNDNNKYYNQFLSKNKKLENSTIILNTPIVKSSILLSQLSSLDIKPSVVLSTQLNYTPLILSLTQKEDRDNIIIASSIGYIPQDIIEYNILNGSDLSYNWVNYSIVVGIEYLINNNIELFHDLNIENNQVVYPVQLYRAGQDAFEKISQ